MLSTTTDSDKCDSVSSSGTKNGDVTIICQESRLQRKITKRLTEKKYDVVDCLIGGREKIKNLRSSAKHSRVRIVIVTNAQQSTFQNELAPLSEESCLPFGSTLILHKASVKKNQIHSFLRKYQLLRLADDDDDIVKQICFYIEASIECDLRSIKDVKERNKLFALLIVGTSINISTSSAPYTEVATSLKDKHGGFQSLGVGNLKHFLQEHPMVSLDGPENAQVSLTEEGSLLISNCRERFSNSFFHRTFEQDTAEDLEASSSDNKMENFSATSDIRPDLVKHSANEIHEKEEQWESEEQRMFYEKLHFVDAHYAFCLITSEMNCCEELKGLNSMPFLKVFDFDPNSRSGGLLNSLELAMKEKRRMTFTTLNQTAERISEQATHWVFMKGLAEQGDTVVTENAYKWQKKYNQSLQENCDNLWDYCVLQKPAVFLIMWYDTNEENAEYLKWFLTYVDRSFGTESNQLPCEFILCLPENPAPESVLTQIKNNLEISDGLVVASQVDVVHWLASCPTQPERQVKITSLPKRNEDETMDEITVPKVQLPWLNDVLEILSSSTPLKITHPNGESYGEEFVRGGLLEWDDIRYGNVAVERVIQNDVCKFIKQEAIDQCKSIVLRVMHAPGGGGTTFARQLLWSLRKSAPCCVLVPTTLFPLNAILERIEVLHKSTHLPVVILIDGRSDSDVERLFASRKVAVVIVHVQRNCTGIRRSRFKGGSCHLAGKVTRNEASSLSQFFSRFSPESTNALTSLRNDVVDGRQSREVFEFGLAAFNHEFKGVQRYVQGYMNVKASDLLWWQKIIAYLSLLKYYGQCGMYGEIFRKLIPGCQKFVSVAQVTAGSQYIIEEEDVWKINYNAVAIEVLELALVKTGNTKKTQPDKLSGQAKHYLHQFVIDFIRFISSTVGDVHLDKLLKILQKVVTTRDYKDLDATDGPGKKWMLSRLLEDVEQDKRILVLEELTNAFPKYAEFHAHLGRLCSFYQGFKQAEKSLNKALELRMQQTKGSDPNRTDNARGRYHHMFGYLYLRKVEYLLNQDLQDALRAAEHGVEHFALGRQFAVHKRIYGYVGEVRVRLLIVETFKKLYEIEKAFSEDVDQDHLGLCQFVRDSHSVCDHLLVECQYYTSQSELSKNKDYFSCVEGFNAHFEKVRVELDKGDNSPNIPLIRSKIASIKMKHKKSNGLRNLDDITSMEDITEVVKLLDNTINSAMSTDNTHVYISVEMQEWLYAIRHRMVPDKYDLHTVWQRLEQWDSRNEFGFSTFYLYVVYILLAMFSRGDKQRKQYWENGMNLFKKIYYKRDDYLIKGKELLADHKGLTIRKLISRRHLGEWDNKQKTWKNKEGIAKLRVCTGTVVKSDQPLIGFISMDLDDPIPNCPIRIFFSPKKYDLHGRRFAEHATRVEFFIAFNSNNGAEAESIRELKKRRCDKCKIATEVVTLKRSGNGKCTKCGQLFQ